MIGVATKDSTKSLATTQKTSNDFRKHMNRTSNIVDQKFRYRSHKECVVLVRIKYLGY